MDIPLSSPHVHTQFGDADSSAEEMVRAALKGGFVSLGFSEHGCQDFDPDYSMRPEAERAYLAEVRRLQQAYRGRLAVRLGVEADRYARVNRADYEYVIASVHYLPCPDGSMLPVDADPGRLREGVRRHFGGDGLRLALLYYESLGEYAERSKPDILGHFDLIMKNNRDGSLFDPEDAAYRRAALEAMERAFQGCTLLEVNTGAMARRRDGAPYPAPWLLRRWRQLGGRVILSSDCHDARCLSVGYPEALALIRQAGFSELSFLGTGEDLFDTVKL